MNELEVQSPDDIQRTQLDIATRQKESAPTAQGVAPRNRSEYLTNVQAPLSEFPIKFIPRVEVYIGALNDHVNAVVKTVKTIETDGETHSLTNPLSVKDNGIAVEALTALYLHMQEMVTNNYILLTTDDLLVDERIKQMVEQLQQLLQQQFDGPAFEMPGEKFAISRRDFYRTSVAVDLKQDYLGAKTVNEVSLVVSVYIHAANLTYTSAKLANLSSSYRKVVRNFAKTGVETTLDVLFDVSNFKERPSLLALFTELCESELAAEVKAQPVANHLPGRANIAVRINLDQTVKDTTANG